ncbi:nucleotidyltransferase domain-containing protein [Streptomyces lydicus]
MVAEQDDPLVFATVSGAHLYGFPSRDSDVDLRGAHLLPAAALVGLHESEETFPHGLNGMGSPHPDGQRPGAAPSAHPGGGVGRAAYVPELIAARAAAEHGPAGDVVDPGRRAAASAER